MFVLLLSISFTGFFAYYLYWLMHKAEQESSRTSSALTTLHVLESLLGDMQDAETGERGYVITSDTSFLKPYRLAVVEIGKDTVALKDATAGDPAKKAYVDQLLGLVRMRMQVSGAVIAAVDQALADRKAMTSFQLTSKELMDQIRIRVTALEEQDRPMLHQANESRKLAAESSSRLFFILAGAFLLALLAFFWLADKQIRRRQDVESQLREIQFSDQIINSLPGIFYLFDNQGRFLRWNKNFEVVSGYSREEMGRMGPFDFVDPQDRNTLRERIQKVFREGMAEMEANFLTREGVRIPYYFTGRRIRFADKDCLVGLGIDLTERHQAEARVREFNERFRLISRATNDAMWDVDMTNQVIWWNEKHYELYGLDPSQPPAGEQAWQERIHPDDRQRVVSLYHDTVRAGKPYMECEYRFRYPDGTYRTLFDRLYATYRNGKPDRVLGTIMDITERKRTEEALRLSERKYYLLFENNPLPMWMVSLPGLQIIDVNTAAIEHYGYTRQEFLGMRTSDLRAPEDPLHYVRPDQQQRTGIRHAGLWRHKKKSGEIIYVDVISHDMPIDGRSVRLVLANDVTEKLKAEEQLQQSYEAIRSLTQHLQDVREQERISIAREIHDELGQQLTVLKMDVSWLRKRLGDREEAVSGKIAEMVSLLNDTVRTVRRISSELRPSVLDDLGLVAAIEWQLKEFEKRTEIITEFTVDDPEPILEKEVKTSIFRILQESLTNVARHANATHVTVDLRCVEDRLILRVEDDGQGFDLQEIRTRRTLGMLGMQERTAMIGGDYAVSSAPGRGTRIVVSVPIQFVNS